MLTASRGGDLRRRELAMSWWKDRAVIELLVLAGLVLAYGLVSGRTNGSSVTAPMVFVAAGLALGDAGLDLFSGDVSEAAMRVLAEATLVLVLFTDAVRIDLSVLRQEYHFPLRLLAIGLPVAVALGTGAAVLIFPQFGWWEAALLAAVLVPTDAALGAAVITDRRLPVRLRQTLNVESGLNDGLALPVVMLFVALAAAAQGDIGSTGSWVWFILRQIGLGVVVGAVVGNVGGWLMRRMDEAGWISTTYRRLAVLALAGLAYGGAEITMGNGFVAAFVAGLCFGSVARAQCPYVHEFAEREGELLTVATFAMFGAVIIGPRLPDVGISAVFYAVVSLVVVRVAAVAIALIGSGVRAQTMLFLGWFGPRGLASILFSLLVVEQAGVAVADDVLLIAGVTVLLSVYAHGVSASSLARGFARHARGFAPTASEHVPVTEHYTRHWS